MTLNTLWSLNQHDVYCLHDVEEAHRILQFYTIIPNTTGFCYASDVNPWTLSVAQILALFERLGHGNADSVSSASLSQFQQVTSSS